MNKSSIRAIALCTIAITFAACQANDEQLEQSASYQQGELTPITFSSNIATRATDTYFESGDQISVTAYSSDNSLYHQNASYTYTDNSIFESESPITYESNIQYLSFAAIYPFTEVSESGDLSFEVMSDQSSDSNYTLSDLMSSYASSTQNITPELYFTHLLTSIVVNITSSDIPIDDAVVTISTQTGVDYNINSETLTPKGETETIKFASNGTNSFKAIMVPQTVSSGVFITVNIDNIDYSLYYANDKTFLPSTQYTYDAEISDGAIRFTPTIEDWAEGDVSEDVITTARLFTDAERATWGLSASATEPSEGALEYIIDGDLSTYWHSPWSDGSGSEVAQWIQVDLGTTYAITSVSIAPRYNTSGVNSGYIEVSTDGSTYNTVSEYALDSSITELQAFDFTQTNARYIKIHTVGFYGMISEVNVTALRDGTYEESGNEESGEETKEIDSDSVTLLDRSSWTLSASDTEPSEGALEYVIDGKYGTYWHSPWSDGSTSTDASSITVNMNATHSLYCVVMLPRAASQYNTGGIYTSLDGSSWTYIQAYACAAEYNWNYFYFDELVDAQYFMFTCENDYGMVDEIHAY
ncbi:MAG: fimbrillin family protein, partial [Rikenellaceae bacterium]